ncbi:MAG: hypothetical protein ACT4N1_04630 [Nitrososphaerota archaeon]
MSVRREKLLVLCCFFVTAVALIMPADADITSFKTDKTFYKKGDKVIFSGTVEDEDVGEFVTIIVEDPAGNFVTLRQGFVTIDKDFTVTIDTKEEFLSHGVYNATGFVVNKTNSVWETFDFSLDGSPVVHPTPQPAPTQQPIPQQPSQQNPSQTQQFTSTPPNDEVESEIDDEEKTIQEKIKERIEAAKQQREAETNPPLQTGSDETGVNQTTIESMATDATKVTGNNPTSGVSTAIDLGSNLLYVVLGLGGAGATAGVVYGINKNRRNGGNKPVVKIREPSERSSVPSENDYALMILKNRLAKGEITIDEFNALKEALRES